MTTSNNSIFAAVIAALIVVSMVAGAVAPAAASPPGDAGPSGMVGVPADNVGPPDHAQGNGGPPGNVGPPSNANIPTHAAAWGVHASDHAGDLGVTVGETPTGQLALVLSDDINHDGREVAVNATTLEQAVGFKPEMAHGLHESGDRWERPITYEDGFAKWTVPKFSSNTVTFDGTFSLSGDPAVDGDRFQWTTSDGGEDLSINVTGKTNSHWDNVTASGVSNGASVALGVGGNVAPSGPSANGEPTVTFTGNPEPSSHDIVDDQGDGGIDGAAPVIGDQGYQSRTKHAGFQFNPETSGNTTSVNVNVENVQGSDYGVKVDVYVSSGGVNSLSSWTDGTKVKDGWDPDFQTGKQTITFDTPASVTAGQNHTITFVSQSSDGDGVKDGIQFGIDNSPSKNKIADGYDSTIAVYETNYGHVNLTIQQPTEDPAIDVDGDGSSEASHSGTLADGESVTKEISSLSESDDTATVSTTKGRVGVEVKLKERTQTVGPVVELNNASDSYQGTLADGETATLSIPDSAIKEGENQLNVSVGDGSLSSDAPTPQVGLNVTHSVAESRSVSYEGEAFSERYSVSKTLPEATEDATLTIPWASDRVVALRDLEVEMRNANGTLQNTDTSPTYTFDNGSVVIELGDVPEGWETTVTATGSKVRVQNGSITVLEPTNAGDTLDSEIQINSKSEGFAIEVGETAEGHFAHHTLDESWSTPESYTTFDANGNQFVRVPGAPDGGTFRIQTAPIEAQPQSGAVQVVILDAEQPEFRIRPAGSERLVDVGWYGAETDTTYNLMAGGSPADTSTADSPVWFSISSDAATYTIEEADGSSSEDERRVVAPPDSSNSGLPMILIIPMVGISVAGLFWAGRRFGGATGIRGNAVLLVGSTTVAIAAVELVSPGTVASIVLASVQGLGSSIVGGIAAVLAAIGVLVGMWQLEQRTSADVPLWVTAPSVAIASILALEAIRPGSVLGALEGVLAEVGGLVVLIVLGIVAYVIYQRRKTKQAEASTPDTSVTLDLGNRGNE